MHSYEFYGSTLEVTESELTIRRGKRGGFGLPKVLTVPLASVVGARYEQPKALSNGHLQVLLAGSEAPPLSALRAANDAHTLIVTKKQSGTAATLADWLTSLAAHNHAFSVQADPQAKDPAPAVLRCACSRLRRPARPGPQHRLRR